MLLAGQPGARARGLRLHPDCVLGPLGRTRLLLEPAEGARRRRCPLLRKPSRRCRRQPRLRPVHSRIQGMAQAVPVDQRRCAGRDGPARRPAAPVRDKPLRPALPSGSKVDGRASARQGASRPLCGRRRAFPHATGLAKALVVLLAGRFPGARLCFDALSRPARAVAFLASGRRLSASPCHAFCAEQTESLKDLSPCIGGVASLPLALPACSYSFGEKVCLGVARRLGLVKCFAVDFRDVRGGTRHGR